MYVAKPGNKHNANCEYLIKRKTDRVIEVTDFTPTCGSLCVLIEMNLLILPFADCYYTYGA